AAVSEGIKTPEGEYVCESDLFARTTDSFGHTQLTGTSRALANLVAEKLSVKVRSIEFSSLQRCAAHISSLTDQNEAFNVGTEAVKAAADGYSGKFIQLTRVSDDPYQCITELCDVALVANLKKSVPPEWINPTGDYITDEFVNYVRPLILGEATVIYHDGLPEHIPSL
ncbi:MAG: 6-phosphofructokinase, partial [Oscillospiraceae bacterium]|nr:6-phosphofructokinase [Oscillospiraceae bacterium]